MFGIGFNLDEAPPAYGQEVQELLKATGVKTTNHPLHHTIDELIQTRKYDTLGRLLNLVTEPDNIPRMSPESQEALLKAHTYVYPDRLEDVMNHALDSPRINQAKALNAFSKHDYINVLTNLTSLPTNKLHRSTRIPYVIALQQEEIPLTKEGQRHILQPLLATDKIAQRIYAGEQLTLNLTNPAETIRDVLSK